MNSIVSITKKEPHVDSARLFRYYAQRNFAVDLDGRERFVEVGYNIVDILRAD
jgi:hypothetical protein